MKKIVKKIIPAKKEREIEEEQVFCDICGEKITKSSVTNCISSRNKCCFCKREICLGHAVLDPEDNSDYPGYYCSLCASLRFVKYKEEIDNNYDEYDKKREELYAKILKESLGEK